MIYTLSKNEQKLSMWHQILPSYDRKVRETMVANTSKLFFKEPCQLTKLT